jgi:hypothetical protein
LVGRKYCLGDKADSDFVGFYFVVGEERIAVNLKGDFEGFSKQLFSLFYPGL